MHHCRPQCPPGQLPSYLPAFAAHRCARSSPTTPWSRRVEAGRVAHPPQHQHCAPSRAYDKSSLPSLLGHHQLLSQTPPYIRQLGPLRSRKSFGTGSSPSCNSSPELCAANFSTLPKSLRLHNSVPPRIIQYTRSTGRSTEISTAGSRLTTSKRAQRISRRCGLAFNWLSLDATIGFTCQQLTFVEWPDPRVLRDPDGGPWSLGLFLNSWVRPASRLDVHPRQHHHAVAIAVLTS